MSSWKEYAKANLSRFREFYDHSSNEFKEIVEKNQEKMISSLNKPCQVVVIDFVDPPFTSFIVVHNKDTPDMDIVALEKVKPNQFSFNMLKRLDLLKELNEEEIRKLFYVINSDITTRLHDTWIWSQVEFKKSALLTFAYKPRPNEFAEAMLGIVEHEVNQFSREKQKKKIETTVDDLKRDAKAIPETVQLKNKILETTSKLENQIEDLNKKVEDEVLALREMVGTDKDHIGWRVFTKDIKHLKETHVAKGEFISEIKRLDEKIENKSKALNTRIEDLKEIKFWSKRTVLEIALTIWGAIVTLYAAGILKF